MSIAKDFLAVVNKKTAIVIARIKTAVELQFNTVERILNNRSLERTADYIEANMKQAKFFRGRYDVLNHAISLFKDEEGNEISDGLFLEFGVYSGTTINMMAKELSVVYGFDSFEGLPEDWMNEYTKGTFKVDKLPEVDNNVELIKGWFRKTLPKFLREHKEDCSLIHMDADLYSSTKDVFNNLKIRIRPGTIIVFDEYFGYVGWEKGEFKAFKELNLPCEYLAYNNTGQVAVRIK